MAGSLSCCKYLMFFFNLLIFLGGAALLGVGIWVLVGADTFRQLISSDPAIFNAVYIIIAVGCFLFIVGFLGCCGAIKENKCMLATFFALILVIFVLEIVGGVLAFVYYPNAKTAALDSMKIYNENTEAGKTAKAAWDNFEKTFQCCGLNGQQDWIKAGILLHICANPTVGCESQIKNYFWVLGGISVGILFVELLAMIFACCLYKGADKERYA
uniref:Tetraspanin n=1 Tax=Phallusia mammillata TaxID=59560 RepID=A0A6F9DWA7_9ASCI|nr:tetraspanin-18 [Phallusia mammillata]